MTVLIGGIIAVVSFIGGFCCQSLFAINDTPYNRMVDDAEQEKFLREYNDKKNQKRNKDDKNEW